jgi:PHD/YefM family antitoxin component YafN of YafNO toxin-antitoxin module
MRSLSLQEAENHLIDTLNYVDLDNEHIAIERSGQKPVYLISAQDYQLFLKLLQQTEDQQDIQEAEKRMNDPQQERLSFDQFFSELEFESESI